MKNNISCKIIEDLLPSYLDGICSEDSRELVEEHVDECVECKALMQQMADGGDPTAWKPGKELDYMKKIRRNVDLKSLFLMVIIILTSGIFSYSTLHFVHEPIVFFIVLPFVLICNSLMFFKYDFRQPKKIERVALALGGIEVVTAGYLIVLMKVLVPSWIERAINGDVLPFHMEMEDLGPFLFSLFGFLLVVAVLIWGITIFLHIKRNKFHAMISSVSIIILYCLIYYRYILARLTDAKEFDTFCNQVVLLLIEGVVVAGILTWIQRIRSGNEK